MTTIIILLSLIFCLTFMRRVECNILHKSRNYIHHEFLVLFFLFSGSLLFNKKHVKFFKKVTTATYIIVGPFEGLLCKKESVVESCKNYSCGLFLVIHLRQQ